MSEPFGAWLKRMRLEKGMTLEELGARIGSSHATIQRYEAGTRGVPFDVALQLADALPVARSRAVAAWIAANADGEIDYQPDPDSIPIPEGYEDDDDAIRSAATAAAQETYRAVVEALREARRLSPGTIGFNRARYETLPQEGENKDEPDAEASE